MKPYEDKVLETAAFLKAGIRRIPQTGILTGTGLGGIVESADIECSFSYETIPNFPVSTVESHTGRLISATISGVPILAMQGRFHIYEGYCPKEVTFPIRVMQELGVRTLIVSNAAGGLDPSFNPGDLMVIEDHINLTGENPLVGTNIDRWGIRFPDMSSAYDPRLLEMAENAGKEMGILVRRGVYAGLKGPSLETPAEIRFLKTIGAQAVGFSTVQEVICAVHANMRVFGISTITNVNNPERPVPATVEDIIAVAAQTAPKLRSIIYYIVEHFNEPE